MAQNNKSNKGYNANELICLEYSFNNINEKKVDYLTNLNTLLGTRNLMIQKDLEIQPEYQFLKHKNYSDTELLSYCNYYPC